MIKEEEHRAAEQSGSVVSLTQLPPKDSTQRGSQKSETSSGLTGLGTTLAVNCPKNKQTQSQKRMQARVIYLERRVMVSNSQI
jgi:hypothetical protein